LNSRTTEHTEAQGFTEPSSPAVILWEKRQTPHNILPRVKPHQLKSVS